MGRFTLRPRSFPAGCLHDWNPPGIQTHRLGYGGGFEVGSHSDATLTASIAQALGARWVVADGYRFGQCYQHVVRHSGCRLAMVADDDSDELWHCDLVHNQNPHASENAYRSDIDTCSRLLGVKYALLRDEFLCRDEVIFDNGTEARTNEGGLDPSRRPPRILVTLGGADSNNVTATVLRALNSLDASRLEVRVLVPSQ